MRILSFLVFIWVFYVVMNRPDCAQHCGLWILLLFCHSQFFGVLSQTLRSALQRVEICVGEVTLSCARPHVTNITGPAQDIDQSSGFIVCDQRLFLHPIFYIPPSVVTIWCIKNLGFFICIYLSELTNCCQEVQVFSLKCFCQADMWVMLLENYNLLPKYYSHWHESVSVFSSVRHHSSKPPRVLLCLLLWREEGHIPGRLVQR